MTRRHPVRTGLAGVSGMLLLGLGVAPVTGAGFTDRAELTGGSLTSGVMAAPGTPAVRQVAGQGTTRVSWTAPAVGQHGAAPSGYDVLRYPAAAGGAATLACSTEVGSAAAVGRALECEDTARAPGTGHYAVRARFGDDWRAESGRRPFVADLAGPGTEVLEPTDGYRGNAQGLRRETPRGCGTETPACGTAEDPAGVTTVRWVLELRPSTGNRALRCWDGGAFGTAGAAGCPERAALTQAVAGGVRWRLQGTADAAYRDRGSYTLTVVAVDPFGNTTTVRSVVTVT